MSDDIKWDLSKVLINKTEVEKTLSKLQLELSDSSIVDKDLAWKLLYLKGIANQNYEVGGHWAIETMEMLKVDNSGSIKEDCLAWFIVSPRNPGQKLRKAVRALAAHCIMIEDYSRDIAATAF